MKKITVRITDKQHEKLKTCYRHTESTMSEQIRNAIDKSVPSFPDFYQIDCTKELPEFKTCIKCGENKKIGSFKRYAMVSNMRLSPGDKKILECSKKFPFIYHSKCKECELKEQK